MNIKETHITKFVAGLAAVTLLSVAACTVETTAAPGETSTPKPQVSETPESIESQEPEDEYSKDANSLEDEQSEGGSSQEETHDRLTREELAEIASRQISCQDGSVEIDILGFVTEITDDCEELTITDGPTIVLAQNVGTLTIEGVGVEVYVKEVSQVIVSEGADIPYVVYEGAASQVDDSGIGSTIVHVDQTR